MALLLWWALWEDGGWEHRPLCPTAGCVFMQSSGVLLPTALGALLQCKSRVMSLWVIVFNSSVWLALCKETGAKPLIRLLWEHSPLDLCLLSSVIMGKMVVIGSCCSPLLLLGPTISLSIADLRANKSAFKHKIVLFLKALYFSFPCFHCFRFFLWLLLNKPRYVSAITGQLVARSIK